MNRVRSIIKESLVMFCYIAIGIQILFSFLYLVLNIGQTNVLLSIVQLGLAIFVVFRFFRFYFSYELSLCFALFANSIPFVLQQHLSSDAYSLETSIILFLLYGNKKWSYRTRFLTQIVASLFFWFMEPLFCFLGVFLILGTMLCYIRDKKNLFWKKLSMVLFTVISLFLVVFFLLTSDFDTKAGEVRMNISTNLVERFAWPHLQPVYLEQVPVEIKQEFDHDELLLLSKFPYQIAEKWQVDLEAAYGKEKTYELNLAVAYNGIYQATVYISKNMFQDILSYTLPLVVMDQYLNGEWSSTTNYAYQQLIEHSPRFTNIYQNISLMLFQLMFLAVLISLLFRKGKMRIVKASIPYVAFMIGSSFVFTMLGTEVYDYRLALLSMILACIPIADFLEQRSERA